MTKNQMNMQEILESVKENIVVSSTAKIMAIVESTVRATVEVEFQKLEEIFSSESVAVAVEEVEAAVEAVEAVEAVAAVVEAIAAEEASSVLAEAISEQIANAQKVSAKLKLADEKALEEIQKAIQWETEEYVSDLTMDNITKEKLEAMLFVGVRNFAKENGFAISKKSNSGGRQKKSKKELIEEIMIVVDGTPLLINPTAEEVSITPLFEEDELPSFEEIEGLPFSEEIEEDELPSFEEFEEEELPSFEEIDFNAAEIEELPVEDELPTEDEFSGEDDIEAQLAKIDTILSSLSSPVDNELKTLLDQEKNIKMKDLEVVEKEEDVSVDATYSENTAPAAPSAPQITAPAAPVIKKGKSTTFVVNGVEVTLERQNKLLRVLEGAVRAKSFKLNDLMSKNKASNETEVYTARMYTVLIRQFALEIAAANNSTTIEGDSGCAYLVAQVQTGALKAPTFTFASDEEKEATKGIYEGAMSNTATFTELNSFVKGYTETLGLHPNNFYNPKGGTPEVNFIIGCALIKARVEIAWKKALDDNMNSVYHTKEFLAKAKVGQEQQA